MNPIMARILVVCVASTVFVGCRTDAIYNIVDSPITTASGKELTLDQVRKAIIEAGSPKWKMVDVQPGHIIGTINISEEQAVVDIKYGTKKYSITYKSSTDLLYHPDKKRIDIDYTEWVQDLDNAIRAKFSTAGA